MRIKEWSWSIGQSGARSASVIHTTILGAVSSNLTLFSVILFLDSKNRNPLTPPWTPCRLGAPYRMPLPSLQPMLIQKWICETSYGVLTPAYIQLQRYRGKIKDMWQCTMIMATYWYHLHPYT